MEAITNFLKELFSPLVVLADALLNAVGWVAAACLSPISFLNFAFCSLIDLLVSVWPVTPDNLKIAHLVAQVADQMPAVGADIIWDILESIAIIFFMSALIKIYKLIPFKAT